MTGKGLVLVTGANGFIAARTVEAFLKAGYSVRGTTRSASSAKGLLAALSDFVSSGSLEVVQVPNIVAPGAYDEAVKGVDAVAHLAAPISLNFTDAKAVLTTATTSLTRILESAAKQPSVKSFIFMSSIVAIKDSNPREEGPYTYTEADWNESAIPLLEKLGEKAPGPLIYSASKVAAEKVFWTFRDEHKPAFSMSTVNPVFVSGPPLVVPDDAEQINETVRYIWEVAAGKEIPEPLVGFSWFVDVRDVAALVVASVEKREEVDGGRVLACAHYGPPQAVADILRKAFPERRDVIKEGSPGEGYAPGFRTLSEQNIDGSKGARVLGREYLPYETTVLDAAKAFEKLL